jgi:transcriptional regulator with XRE-family HTH domain
VAKRSAKRRSSENPPPAAYDDLLLRVSENLCRIHARRCLTQEEIAELCNLDVRMIQRVEAGDTNFTALTLARLAAGLGLDITDLVAPVTKHQSNR